MGIGDALVGRGREGRASNASDAALDGFPDGVRPPEFAYTTVDEGRAQAGTVDGVAAHLAAEAVARGNNDNCSVVVVEFVWGAEG